MKNKINLETTLCINTINIESSINELYSETKTSIKMINLNDTSKVELKMKLPLAKNSVLQKFEAIKNNQKIVSKIYKKEKAEEKFSDAIAQGNMGLITTIKEDKPEEVEVNIGNLEPKETIEFILYSVDLNSTVDKSICFTYNPALLPSIDNVSLKDKTLKADVSFSGVVTSNSPITRLISKNYSQQSGIKYSFSDDLKLCDITINKSTFTFKNTFSPIDIIFRTDSISDYKIYEQYDNTLKQYAYSLNFLVDKYQNIDPVFSDSKDVSKIDTDAKKEYQTIYDSKVINDYPASFIFLLDQSGSMSGSSIKLAKEALILFIKSLPQGSKFKIIGFGSSYANYCQEGFYDYNEDRVQQAIKLVNSLSANLGGTDILNPLKFIYQEDRKSTQVNNLPQNIILLTDGEVSNSRECCEYVKVFHESFRLCSIGIGSGVDFDFISKIAESGNGTSHLVPELNDLNETVINALNMSLKPYLSKVKVELPSSVTDSSFFDYPSLSNNKLFLQDTVFNYSFTTSNRLDGNDSVTFSYYDNSLEQEVKKIITIKDYLVTLNEGDSLRKLVIGLKLKLEKMENFKEEDKENLAVKHQVLSPYTAIFAEIEQDSSTKESTKIEIDGTESNILNANAKEQVMEKLLNSNEMIDDFFSSKVKKSKKKCFNKPNTALKNVVKNKISNDKQFLCSALNNLEKDDEMPKKCMKRAKLSSIKKSCKESDSDEKCEKECKIEEEDDDDKLFYDFEDEVEKNYEKRIYENTKSAETELKRSMKEEKKKQMKENEAKCKMSIQKESKKPEKKEIKVNNPIIVDDKNLFQSIIQYQGIAGNWKDDFYNALPTTLTSKYNDIKEKVLKYVTNNNLLKQGASVEECVATIVLLLILNKEFLDKKEEFKLIENKSIKYLQKLGLNYDEVIKSI